jgi:hypothetical protein
MPTRIKHAAWMLASCLALPGLAAAAAEPQYTYVEASYLNTDFDNYGDGDGFQLGGSYALNRNFHVVASYQSTDLDRNADYNAFSIGAGVNYPLRPGLDLVGRARFISASLDQPGDDDEDGYSLEGLMRVMINPQLELNGGILYEDVYDDNTALEIGGLYEVAKNVSVGAGLVFSDDTTAFNVGVRFYFAPPAQLR